MLKVLAQLVSQLGVIGGAVIAGLSRRISGTENILPGIFTDVGLAGVALATLSCVCLTLIAWRESRAEAVERRRMLKIVVSLERRLQSEQWRAIAALEKAERRGADAPTVRALIGAARMRHASQVVLQLDQALDRRTEQGRPARDLISGEAQLAVSRLRQVAENGIDLRSQISLKASEGGYAATIWQQLGRFVFSFLAPFSVTSPRPRGAFDEWSR